MATNITLKNSTNTAAPSSLLAGELAIATATGAEKIYFKNAAGTIININDWSKLTSKPTTLTGFGITDSTNISTYNTHVASNLHLTNAQRNVLNVLTIDAQGNLQINTNLFSTGEVAAYSTMTGSTAGGGAASYDRLDYWNDYTSDKSIYVLSALLGNDLNNRILGLEGGSASTIVINGTGNVVTNIVKSGTTINVTKSSTAILEGDSRLTNARKNPYTLSFAGFSTANYDGSANVTVSIPTKVSQLTNDSAFLTAINKSQVEGVLTGAITSHTHNYLSGNQIVTLSGDATGAGTTAITVTLASVGTAGTYKSVTVDAKGRVTGGTNPNTLAGYGITDALSSAGGTISGNLTVTGNLTLNGTTTTVNSTTMTLDDPILTLGGDTAATVNDSKDRGVEFRYFDTTAKIGFFGYDASTKYFTCYTDATNTSEVFSGTIADIQATNFRGNLIGDTVSATSVSATTFTGNLTGNASTSTKLLTARTISIAGDTTGSAAFDGSANITITTAIASNSVALGTDTTGNYAASVAVAGTGLSIAGAAGEGTAFTITSNATNLNTASTIVARDASGNFTAGTITAALTGNASTASKLATARTIAISGTVAGTVNFDGSANVTITTVIAALDGGTW